MSRVPRWGRHLPVGLLLLSLLAACRDLPTDLPPGTCVAGEHTCYWEPNQERLLLLRCNAGEVEGAIWIIDQVCDHDTEDCDGEACVSIPFASGAD